MSDLLSINVNEHTERKGNLTYLSWAWAWAEVLKHDPGATWEVYEYSQPDGTMQPCMWIAETAMVKTAVTINGKKRECQLAVMDNKNNAVKNPDARKISDTIMRCMTKAIAMHGLGLYIYAGEDLPQVEPEPVAPATLDGIPMETLEEVALYLIDCHDNEKEAEAIRVWYDLKTFDEQEYGTAQEARKWVWSQLGKYSKLRSAIKNNNPHPVEKKAA